MYQEESLGGEEIAGEVLDAGRGRPLVIVSIDTRYPTCTLDTDWIRSQLDGLADVYALTKASLRQLSSHLPPGADLYGNAVRVYEPGAFTSSPGSRFRARPAFGPDQAKWAMQGAVSDALACTHTTPLHSMAPPKNPSPMPRQVSARIRGFIQSGMCALATGPDDELLTINGDDLIPGIRLDWLLDLADVVTGTVAPSTSALNLASSVPKHRLAEVYKHGQTVLALTRNVTSKSFDLTLFPGSTWTIQAGSGTGPENYPLPSEGEVVCALFYRECGAVRLSLELADRDSLAASPPLLKGGKPWLQLGRDMETGTTDDLDSDRHPTVFLEAQHPSPSSLSEVSTTTPASSVIDLVPPLEPTSSGTTEFPSTTTANQPNQARLHPGDIARTGRAPVPQADGGRVLLDIELRTARRDLAQELRENAELRNQLAQAVDRNRSLKMDNDSLKKKFRDAAQAAAASYSRHPLFLDRKEALRHEIYNMWASYIPGTEKVKYPAPEHFEIGDLLADSLDRSTDENTREKALQTIVDLLVERQERQRIMAKKPLRTGSSTSKPQLMRWDGSTAWRVRVENNTPQALRLHYWLRPDRTVELSTVDRHDSFVA